MIPSLPTRPCGNQTQHQQASDFVTAFSTLGVGPLGGSSPLIDVHSHFLHAGCGRADWEAVNDSRLRAGDRIGINCHVASILGSWGYLSPTYFPSPTDVSFGNDAMVAFQEREGHRVRGYAVVNPNYTSHALTEIARCVARGLVGVKLLASRRADDPLLDPLLDLAAEHGLPVLHHIWQHRTRSWPNQDVSDGSDLGRLAARHPMVPCILAHIGGGGDYAHTFAAVADIPNVYLDLSGSGVDRGMLDDALAAVGPQRLLWGADVTLETGLAKLWALEVIGLTDDELAAIRWRNAVGIFPPGTFPMIDQPGASAS